MSDKPEFVYVIYIASTPEKVWKALTDGKFSRVYWAGRVVESDLMPGSPMRFRKSSGAHDEVRCRIIEAKPPELLIMSWAYELKPGDPITPASRVTYRIQEAGPENVKLTVIHEVDEPGSEVDEGLKQGWPAILSSLKSFLETGDALDITKRWDKEGK